MTKIIVVILLKGVVRIALTDNESRVLDLIRRDPYLSQAAISEQLDLNRSTVASIIASLIAKRHLKGRAYVVNQTAEIYCVGAMNVDRIYRLQEPISHHTSNPVVSSVTLGGVGRNIAENLGRLGESVSMLSLAGYDADFDLIRRTTQAYVRLDHVQQLAECSTSSYTAVLNEQGEMEVAFADMAVCDRMNGAWVQEHTAIFQQAAMIVADLNPERSAIKQLIHIAKTHVIPLVIVPVSGPKMHHLPSDLKGVTWLIVNQDESERFLQKTVQSEEDFNALGKQWLELGVENVVITRGTRSILYTNQEQAFKHFQPKLSDHVVDVTGAGDSFSSGIIYGLNHGYPVDKCIQLGMANSYFTVQSPSTVRTDLSREQLEADYQFITKQD